MIIVKITALLIVITLLLRFCICLYIESNPIKKILVHYNADDSWYMTVLGIFVCLDIICVLASAVWFLFIR